MKRIFALFIAVMFIGVNASALGEPTYESYQVKVNATQKRGEPVRTLKLVRFSATDLNTATLSSESVVIYDTTSDDGVSVSTTATSNDGAIAGVVATGVTIPTADSTATTKASDDAGRRNWGWIVVHGPTTARVTAGGSNSHSVGDPIVTSSDRGAITGYSGASLANVQRHADGGFFLDAAGATDTTAEVFVMLE